MALLVQVAFYKRFMTMRKLKTIFLQMLFFVWKGLSSSDSQTFDNVFYVFLSVSFRNGLQLVDSGLLLSAEKINSLKGKVLTKVGNRTVFFTVLFRSIKQYRQWL